MAAPCPACGQPYRRRNLRCHHCLAFLLTPEDILSGWENPDGDREFLMMTSDSWAEILAVGEAARAWERDQ